MAVDMFLALKGEIEGESQDSKHKNEIDVLAWSWGMSQSGSFHVGGGGGAGKVDVQDIVFTHNVDSATPALMKFCCTGNHFDEAELVLCKAAGDKRLPYITVKLKNVLISSVSSGGADGDPTVVESVSLNFREYEYKYQPQSDSGGKKGGEKKCSYNVATGKAA